MLLLGNMHKMRDLGQFSPCVKFKVTKLPRIPLITGPLLKFSWTYSKHVQIKLFGKNLALKNYRGRSLNNTFLKIYERYNHCKAGTLVQFQRLVQFLVLDDSKVSFTFSFVRFRRSSFRKTILAIQIWQSLCGFVCSGGPRPFHFWWRRNVKKWHRVHPEEVLLFSPVHSSLKTYQ